jgi:hypothetical protein
VPRRRFRTPGPGSTHNLPLDASLLLGQVPSAVTLASDRMNLSGTTYGHITADWHKLFTLKVLYFRWVVRYCGRSEYHRKEGHRQRAAGNRHRRRTTRLLRHYFHCGYAATGSMYATILEPFAHLAKSLIIRTAGESLAMSNVMQRVVGEVDGTQVVNKIQSMEQIVAERVSPWRFLMEIFGILAGIALTLAAVGIFGVMSYTVSRRTHEIGVRMALGAGAPDVLGLMMQCGLRLAVPGIVLGLGGSFALTRLIGSMLFEVPPNDPSTLSIVSLLLMGVALAACYFPARRATSVDPVKALRNE